MESANLAACLSTLSDCSQAALDYAPLLSALVALLALAAGAFHVSRQLKQSALLTRYEAVRHKRAIAKALRDEIETLANLAASGHKATPEIFLAVAADIGRLDDESIRDVVRFYASYNAEPASTKEELALLKHKSITSLDSFIEEKTKTERDRLTAKFKKPLEDKSWFELE